MAFHKGVKLMSKVILVWLIIVSALAQARLPENVHVGAVTDVPAPNEVYQILRIDLNPQICDTKGDYVCMIDISNLNLPASGKIVSVDKPAAFYRGEPVDYLSIKLVSSDSASVTNILVDSIDGSPRDSLKLSVLFGNLSIQVLYRGPILKAGQN
ncbi:MAG: hypothetical protein C5B49_16055 [Bdellovibrio sp.]|nr:MAG: hypothetical protein C5B49_16055 [Bdellovibrio sp.]